MIPFASGSRNLDRLAVRNRRLDFAFRSAPIGSDLDDSSQTHIPSIQKWIDEDCYLHVQAHASIYARPHNSATRTSTDRRCLGILTSLFRRVRTAGLSPERHERKPIVLHGVSVHLEFAIFEPVRRLRVPWLPEGRRDSANSG